MSFCSDSHVPDLLVFPHGTDLHDSELVRTGHIILQVREQRARRKLGLWPQGAALMRAKKMRFMDKYNGIKQNCALANANSEREEKLHCRRQRDQARPGTARRKLILWLQRNRTELLDTHFTLHKKKKWSTVVGNERGKNEARGEPSPVSLFRPTLS
jgi:hypothetical protein